MARSVTPLTLVALFAGGCAFIDDYSRFTFDGGTGPTDGSIDVVGDAAPPDGTTDTGPPPETCDAPCLADAFLDFSTEQGSEPLAWRYEAQLFADHLDYFPLVQGNHRGLDGWVGSPAPPAILPCGDASAPCAAAGELVLDASSDTGPVLLTTVGMAGRYAVEVSARPIGDAPAALWVSRNSAADLVGYVPVDPDGGPTSTTVNVEASAGDRILVALRNPTGATEATVGANVRISASASPSTCEHVVRFDGDRTDDCGGNAYEADGSGTLPPLSGAPAPYLGMAQTLMGGSSGVGLIATDQTIDRSGDFTAQLWVNIARQDYVTSSIYQDWSGGSSSGINFNMEDPSGADLVEAYFLYRDDTNTDFPGVTCTGGDCDGVLSFGRPPDDRWFHLRLTRSTADDTVRVCVDGVEVASTRVQAGADMSSALSPKVGVNFGGTPTHRLDGTVDDIRHFSEALPCAPPP